MPSIEILQKLRPLKFAYVVKPNDLSSLDKVVRLNTFLWGGRYNPVFPLYKKTPSSFREKHLLLPKASELFEGNVRFYEPDFLVCGLDITKEDIPKPPCEVINLADIADNINKEGRPGHGVGLIEVLKGYYDKEYKFLRRDKLTHYMPDFGNKNGRFLRTVFGDLPNELDTRIKVNVQEALEADIIKITSENYLSYLAIGSTCNLYCYNSYQIKIDYTRILERERYIIFLMNPNSFIDLVDYINLKAAGFTVAPIALEIERSEENKKICLEFINKHAWVHRDNPHAKFGITIQKSRSVSERELKNFYHFISPPKFEDDDWPKYTMRTWMPDFWSKSHQEQGVVKCTPIIVSRKETDIQGEDKCMRVKTLDPDFIDEFGLRTGGARYANDISINIIQSKDFEARIYPSDSREVALELGMLDESSWRIKNTGITYVCYHSDFPIFFEIQKADKVFLSWLKLKGWKAHISDAGKVAYHMLRHLEGPWGLHFLKSKALIDFITSSSWPVNVKDFKAKVNEIKNKDFNLWDLDEFLRKFIDYKILQLGTELQCSVCSRRSWHAINELDYSLKCPHCLSSFELPSYDPNKIRWSYKAIGPFSARGKGAGAFPVLLTAKFFNGNGALEGITTTILSFELEKDGIEKFEVDMALFYRKGSYFDRSTHTIFCECKTENDFSNKDVKNMKALAIEFPGAMLVFSTLKKDLSAKEKRLLRPFVERCNMYYEHNKPRNPVLILTANELFDESHPPYCWKGKGGKFEEFAEKNYIHGLLSICQASQKLYLGMNSWSEKWEKEWKKKLKEGIH
ncbi:MAG: hypothetical protein GY797_27260 [Deltaproteobacteria bacterium]|nr:hypothetical protein [Deltaproteobacteria bacterium]